MNAAAEAEFNILLATDSYKVELRRGPRGRGADGGSGDGMGQVEEPPQRGGWRMEARAGGGACAAAGARPEARRDGRTLRLPAAWASGGVDWMGPPDGRSGWLDNSPRLGRYVPARGSAGRGPGGGPRTQPVAPNVEDKPGSGNRV